MPEEAEAHDRETYQPQKFEKVRLIVTSRFQHVVSNLKRSDEVYNYPEAVNFPNGVTYSSTKESTLAKAVEHGIDSRHILVGVETRITDKPYRVTTVRNSKRPEEETLALLFNPEYNYTHNELDGLPRSAILETGYMDHKLASEGVKLTPHKLSRRDNFHTIRVGKD